MTREELKDIFQAPFSYANWSNLLTYLFAGAGKNCQLKPEAAPVAMDNVDDSEMDGYYLGEVSFGLQKLKLYAFHVKDATTNIKRNRVGLRNTVSYIKDYDDAAIVVYYNDTQWRVSYIRDIITAPKRYTYVFGESHNRYSTPISRFELLTKGDINFDTIYKAFEVEALGDDFFKEYKKRYQDLCKSKNLTTKNQRDYVKKMMGRLVFLQFLQKKGWMCSNYNYLQDLYVNSEYKDDFLEKVLEPLFFGVLNTKECDRNAEKLKVLGEKVDIPYLNGGLFEQDTEDSKYYRFDKSHFEGIFDFFSHYNFTIDENDPNDAEVGIDPEMLGHIFENLLEDNNDKGAFYTPKEIVQYMSRESLIQYLKTHTEERLHPAIVRLVNDGKVDDLLQNRDNANEINDYICSVKICDPAIGSGAFPMGLLNELFHCRQLLYGFTQTNGEFIPAQVKREIIQNNIFGVDIEQGAVDIARLRFWLALVVDETEKLPLPNLDYKIMCGNSLLSRYTMDMSLKEAFANYNSGKSPEDQLTGEKYKKLVANFTSSCSGGAKTSARNIIAEIKAKFNAAIDLRDRAVSKADQKLIGKYSAYLKMGQSTMFDSAVDESKLSKESQKELNNIRRKLAAKASQIEEIKNNKLYEDAFEWRFEFPALLGANDEFVGFDIVIGNPPYLRIQGIRDVDSAMADEYLAKYTSATGAFDLYALFVERGLTIANQTDGVVNYIMPVKWTNAAFGKGLRKTIASKKAANRIITFGAYQVFNASTYTGLQWFKPNSEAMQYCELDRNLYTNEELGNYLSTLDVDSYANIPAEKLTEKTWVLTVGETTKILNRLEQQPRRVSDIFEKIFQGLATSKDDVYFLYDCIDCGDTIKGSSKHLKEIIEIEKELVKPLLKGDSVHRYDNISTDKVVIFPYKLEGGKANLYTESEISESFPMGYAYLKRCEEVLRGREKGRLKNDDFWFKYIYPKSLTMFDKEKLVAPDISMGGNFAYDAKGEFYSTTTIYGYVKKSEVSDSYKVLMAILNSRLCWWFLTNTGTTLANGFFRFKPDYINPFPVPSYDSIAKVEKVIEVLVDYMVYLYDDTKSDIIGHTPNKRIRSQIDNILNMVIYELYFEDHMREVGIDVIGDLSKYNFEDIVSAKSIEDFYLWYQSSDSLIRQKIMLIDSRSKELIHLINKSKIYE